MTVEVNFDRRGSGSPLVLLHGIGHRWQAWEPVLDLLAERHDVIALDLPGFGGSPAMAGGYGLPAAMARMRTIFDALGLDRPHVAGNSLGGLLAVEAAVQGMAASATALSPAGFWSPCDRLRARASLRLLATSARAPLMMSTTMLASKPLRSTMLAMLYAHPGRISRDCAVDDLLALRGAAGFDPTLHQARTFRWHGTAPAVPLTIAWGARDRILPARQAKRAATLLPDANHVQLPGCGHVPMIDDPQRVAEVILDTCAGASTPRAVS